MSRPVPVPRWALGASTLILGAAVVVSPTAVQAVTGHETIGQILLGESDDGVRFAIEFSTNGDMSGRATTTDPFRVTNIVIVDEFGKPVLRNRVGPYEERTRLVEGVEIYNAGDPGPGLYAVQVLINGKVAQSPAAAEISAVNSGCAIVTAVPNLNAIGLGKPPAPLLNSTFVLDC